MKSVTASLHKALYVLLFILANNFLSTTTALAYPSNLSVSTCTKCITTTTPAPSLRAPQLQIRHHTIPAVTSEAAAAAATTTTTTTTTTIATETLTTSNMLEKIRDHHQQKNIAITTIPNALKSTKLVQKANAKRLERQTRSNPDLPLTGSTNETNLQNKRQRSFSRTFINDTNKSPKKVSPHLSNNERAINSTLIVMPTAERNHHEQKSYRMVQRLAAGHIENGQNQLDVTNDISIKASNRNQYRNRHLNNTKETENKKELTANNNNNLIKTTDVQRNELLNDKSNIKSNNKNAKSTIQQLYNNDEALLDSNDDDDNNYDNDDDSYWDHGILRLSAGSGKEKTYKLKKSKEDSKKTLADQIRDGKYGLIEKELFRKQPKRPGILSYLPNKEMPHDNEHNYGGLNEDDIWLAEDHLLVIKGGSLNKDNIDEPWPAIDDYEAPDRQIKIPDNPKVPPPFPVQLEENGPVQLIGNNKFTIVYPITNKSVSLYTTSQKAHNTPSESDSDDEKNFITRPGTSENIEENQPPHYYTTPISAWLSQNKTLVSSNLNHSYVPPINYSYLGKFPLIRNISYDNSLIKPEDFDEDDPTLYYPHSYSFVYKSNYTNPVPPGPLVPGIVVPPPYNQFSRLTNERKQPTTTTTSKTTITPSSWSTRFKLYEKTKPEGTTSTTVNPQIQTAFHNTITKITEYTPKTINVVSIRPSTEVPSTPITSIASNIVKPIRVPVAVPVPIYPVNFEATRQPITTSYISTTPIPKINTEAVTDPNTITIGNPFYYEYFEAKRQPTISNIIDDFLATTPNDKDLRTGLLSPKPIKLSRNQNDTYKNQRPTSSTSTNVNNSSNSEEDNVVVITPKPEIRYSHRPIYKPSPHVDKFKQEVNALREKLQYYQNQEIRENNILRTPKAKAVFEYNFDGVKSTTDDEKTNNFQPPNSFDDEPFKPMVTYSPAINDENAFQALTVDKADDEVIETNVQARENANNLYSKYATTTLLPALRSNRFKKLRLGAKYLHPSSVLTNYQQLQQQIPLEYENSPRFSNPWLTGNKKEKKPLESYQAPIPILNNRNRDFTGYYYQSVQQKRPNNRFYDGPFYNIPNHHIYKYRPQQQQLQQQQQHLTQLPEPIWSLENDTYVNYAPNRPPINPDAEFINPYQTVPINQPYHVHRLPAITMPAYSHQSQYFVPAQRMQITAAAPQLQSQPLVTSQPQQSTLRQYQQVPSSSNLNVSPGHSLHRDILVNYRQPLPPLNPDSEFIVHPQVVKNNFYRTENYRLPSTTANENSNIYYITPKYRRASNANNNHNKFINNNNNNINNNNNNNNNHNSQYFNRNMLNSGIVNDNYNK